MNTRNIVVFALLILLALYSCKKKKNDNPFGSVRISKVDVSRRGAITHHNIYYDANNNIDSIMSIGDGTSAGHNTYKKFRYFGTSFDITDENNFTFTVYAYSNGLIFKVLVSDTIGMLYTGTQLTAIDVYTRTTTHPYYKYTRTNYNWKNGDLDATTSGSTTIGYKYDAGKNGQPTDPLRIIDILKYGRPIIRTTHLPTEAYIGATWLEKYYYQFDGSGRITTLTKVGNNNGIGTDDTTVYSYSYY
ncbi:MAG: hypothetical protein K0Q79_781 [Flavipsychrobacter sp.]|jgi:hypothetical protein|nr:hypothetical protein [Flavipsychrobacter sp.]